MTQKPLLTINEFCAFVGICRSNYYKIQERARKAGSPGIPTVMIGSRRYVRSTAAEAWIANLPES